MILIYEILQYALVLTAGVFIGYQLLLGILALLPQTETLASSKFHHSFLIVIPSHNDEQEISKTLYSLSALVYPTTLFKLMVITQSPKGNTAKVARKLGATVVEKAEFNDGASANILRWSLNQSHGNDDHYDAIVVIEPGSLVSGNFLEVMNKYLQKGSKVVQSSSIKMLRAPGWRTKIRHLRLLLYDHVNLIGRKFLGFDTWLLGNGMCFEAGVLKNNALKFYQLDNSLESSLSMMDKGIHIDYAPEAFTWNQSAQQNREVDEVGSLRGHLKRIKKMESRLKQYRQQSPLQYFANIIELMTPSLWILGIGTAGMVLLNWLLWKINFTSAFLFWVWLVLSGMMVIYLSIGWAVNRSYQMEINNNKQKHIDESGIRDMILPDYEKNKL